MEKGHLINSHRGAWEGDRDEIEDELVLKSLAGLPQADGNSRGYDSRR
jgi:hypothetical protein